MRQALLVEEENDDERQRATAYVTQGTPDEQAADGERESHMVPPLCEMLPWTRQLAVLLNALIIPGSLTHV